MNFAYKESEFATKKSYQHAIEHGFNGKNKDNKKVKKSGAKKQWTMADVKKGCTKSMQQKQAAKTEKTITNLMQKLKVNEKELRVNKKENNNLKKKIANLDQKVLTLQEKLVAAKRRAKEMQKKVDRFKKNNAPPRDKYGFTKRSTYRKWLKDHGFDLEGQDVNHIIACDNGGADHVDNYFYTTGVKYNRSIKAEFDAFNCTQAGLEMTKRAIEACKLAEKLKDVCPNAVEKRGGNKKRTYWSEGVHAGKTAAQLIAQGNNWFRTMRLNLRQDGL